MLFYEKICISLFEYTVLYTDTRLLYLHTTWWREFMNPFCRAFCFVATRREKIFHSYETRLPLYPSTADTGLNAWIMYRQCHKHLYLESAYIWRVDNLTVVKLYCSRIFSCSLLLNSILNNNSNKQLSRIVRK